VIRQTDRPFWQAALFEFRKQVGERQTLQKVETGLMAINGEIEMFS
jgi:hypothetical protein